MLRAFIDEAHECDRRDLLVSLRALDSSSDYVLLRVAWCREFASHRAWSDDLVRRGCKLPTTARTKVGDGVEVRLLPAANILFRSGAHVSVVYKHRGIALEGGLVGFIHRHRQGSSAAACCACKVCCFRTHENTCHARIDAHIHSSKRQLIVDSIYCVALHKPHNLLQLTARPIYARGSFG